jgi:hypothetical protein
MGEPLDDLIRLAEEMSRRRLLTQFGVHDREQLAALKEHLESAPKPPGGLPDASLFCGAPIYYDEDVPVGILRCYFNDNTTQDVRLT